MTSENKPLINQVLLTSYPSCPTTFPTTQKRMWADGRDSWCSSQTATHT